MKYASADLGAPRRSANESRVSGHVPGEEGVWLFIVGDLMVFSVFFLTFAYDRAHEPLLYRQSQSELSSLLGLVNTLLMLTSSWFVARAVAAMRADSKRGVIRLLLSAMACGVGFVVVKFFEYREGLVAGHTLTTNDFFMYYYMLTGIHLLHVLAGLGVLLFMSRLARAETPAPTTMMHIESGASVWHLVDLLWIVLFALLYLLR